MYIYPNMARRCHGRWVDFLHKCGKLESPRCDCGSGRETVSHLVQECATSVEFLLLRKLRRVSNGYRCGNRIFKQHWTFVCDIHMRNGLRLIRNPVQVALYLNVVCLCYFAFIYYQQIKAFRSTSSQIIALNLIKLNQLRFSIQCLYV